MKDLKFKTIGQAMREVKLTYLTKTVLSAKLMHSVKVSNVITTGMYLAPANQSGYNTCSHSTPECRMACLNTSGRAAMEVVTGSTKISNSRNIKTRLFYENTAYFMQWLIAEIKRDKAKTEANGHAYAVRLNCTSDIDWANVIVDGKTIFEIFPDVQFYDYTKNWNKFKDIAPNYHLTFSYTGKNANIAKSLLKQGFNVAVVFNTKVNKPLPKSFAGCDVVDGDLTDYRPSDGKGVIVGLRFKLIGDKKAQAEALKSVFIVDENDLENSKLAQSFVKESEMIAA